MENHVALTAEKSRENHSSTTAHGDEMFRGVASTDKDVWNDPNPNSFNRIFVTEGGHVGLSFGGRCVVKPMSEWVDLGWENPPHEMSLSGRIDRLEDAVHELNPGLRLRERR